VRSLLSVDNCHWKTLTAIDYKITLAVTLRKCKKCFLQPEWGFLLQKLGFMLQKRGFLLQKCNKQK